MRIVRGILSGLALALSVTVGTRAELPAQSSPASRAEPLVTEGYVNAPLAEVWRIFTTADGLRTAGIAQADIDLRVGGAIRSREAGGHLGDPQTLVREILAFDPERMLALRVTRPPAGFPHSDALAATWTVIYFTPSGQDMTHVRIVGLGYGGDSGSQALRQWAATADRATLDAIAKRYWPKCKLCTTEPAAQGEQ